MKATSYHPMFGGTYHIIDISLKQYHCVSCVNRKSKYLRMLNVKWIAFRAEVYRADEVLCILNGKRRSVMWRFFVVKTLLNRGTLTLLMKALQTSRCINQRRSGQPASTMASHWPSGALVTNLTFAKKQYGVICPNVLLTWTCSDRESSTGSLHAKVHAAR